MDWTATLQFVRGPFFKISLLVFVGGMTYRLVRVVLLGWPRDRVEDRGSKFAGVVKTYLKGLLVLPFIPWVKRTFARNPLTYVAGGLFHLSLLAVVVFGTPHMLAWKALLGFGWPTLPFPVTDWLAAVGIVSLILLLVNRLTHPVLRRISRGPVWISWLIVFLSFLTGYLMTHHLFFRYEVLFSLHMIAVNVLLIWIPFSRVSHFLFYFFSRTIHGAQAGKRAVNP